MPSPLHSSYLVYLFFPSAQWNNVYFVYINAETGFCDSEVDETDWGTYPWPETVGGSRATLTCMEERSISVTRECQTGGRWNTPGYGGCALLSLTVSNIHTNISQKIVIVLHFQEASSDEDLGMTSAIVAEQVQNAEQTDDNVQLVRDYLVDRADLVRNNLSLVDEEVYFT